jgi:8-oxo-dGTP pyrophosphatase MutT (NUDIX family)
MYMTRETVRLLLLDERKRMLLVKKTTTQAWHWAGGKKKPGEEVEAALVREVYEETGLEIICLTLLHTELLPEETIHCYTAVCKNKRAKKPDGKEIDAICWRSLTGAQKLPLTETQKRLLQNLTVIALFL